MLQASPEFKGRVHVTHDGELARVRGDVGAVQVCMAA